MRLTHRVELEPVASQPPLAGPVGCTVRVDADGVAVLAGEIDLFNAEAVGRELAVAELHTVDLSQVSHLDSTGARMLFGLPARPTFIVPPGSPPRRTLEVSSLAEVMDLRDAPPA